MVKISLGTAFLSLWILQCLNSEVVKAFKLQPNLLLTYRRNGVEMWRREKIWISQPPVGSKSRKYSKGLQSSMDEENNHVTERYCLPQKVTKSLDLIPLIDSVSRYCTTRRGKNAMTNLIDSSLRENRLGLSNGSENISERRMNLFQYDASLLRTSKETSYKQIDHKPIISIAKSAQEAREEYARIGEAMRILNKSENNNDKEEGHRKSSEGTEIPPIYGVSSSPWDVNDPITDDDEWLKMNSYEVLELENIIQAEQIVKTLLACRRWSVAEPTKTFAPFLSKLYEDINFVELELLYEEIKDAIIIKREISISDITGSKSYSFKLNEDKFPQLILLRKKEMDLMSKMDESMKEFLKKYSLPNSKASLKALDMDGRLVVPAPRNIADSLGIVRGFSKNGDMSYVEPNSLLAESNDLAHVKEDLSALESEIQQRLSTSIFQRARWINSGLDYIAKLDTIFARSAFGLTMNGIVPIVENEGIINIDSFVHPLLAMKERQTGNTNKSEKVVSINLKLGEIKETSHEALIISGPNGGGKTLAMKSFGLTAMMCKLGLPITVNVDRRQQVNKNARVDFFQNIFAEVGDTQSVLEGESTLIARLNGYSTIIQKLSKNDVKDKFEGDDARGEDIFPKDSLILLDELGGGTDPVAGAAIAQAILEKMLDTNRCHVVVTTHSLQLKALPSKDARFQSAAVLLSNIYSHDSKYKLPSFQLSYGSIGDSYGLGAASRCLPVLPDDVMERASDLIIGQEGEGEMIRDINNALEKEREIANTAKMDAYDMKGDARLARDGTIALARAYKTHFSRLENRLESIFSKLQEHGDGNDYSIIGDSLSEVRLTKKQVKTHEELLAEKGLRGIPSVYSFREDEPVVIVKKGEWEGMTANVISVDSKKIGDMDANIPWNEVTVMPSFEWNPLNDEGGASITTLTFRPNEIALWDYYAYDTEMSYEQQPMEIKSVNASNQRLHDILGTIESKAKSPSSIQSDGKKISSSNKSTFKSAQERKLARAEAKKSEKDKKRQSKKRRKK